MLSTLLDFWNNHTSPVSARVELYTFFNPVVSFEPHAGFKSKEHFSLDKAAKNSAISVQVQQGQSVTTGELIRDKVYVNGKALVRLQISTHPTCKQRVFADTLVVTCKLTSST